MRVAAGQFAVTPVWRTNAQTCVTMMQQAAREGAALLVLPEALLARDDNDPDISVKSAQPLDGAFLQLLLAESGRNRLTTVLTLHVPSAEGRATNTLVVLRDGEVIAHYHKLHLYDAFAMQESRRVDPGQQIPPVIEVAGLRVGLMTCYDLRFPELALSLALNGAELLVLPTAWVRGATERAPLGDAVGGARARYDLLYRGGRRMRDAEYWSEPHCRPAGNDAGGAGSEPQLIFADVSAEHLARVRERLPVLQNRRFAPPQLL